MLRRSREGLTKHIHQCVRYGIVYVLLVLSVYGDENRNKINFENGVREFYNRLNEYAERSLGTTFLQNHYNTLSTKTIDIGQGILDEMVKDFESTTQSASKLVHSFKKSIEDDYDSQPRPSPGEYHSCCGYNRDVKNSTLYLDEVNFNEFCEISQPTVD